MLTFDRAGAEEFSAIRDFYWRLIDRMSEPEDHIGWRKGVYPADALLRESLEQGELYVLREDGVLRGSVILNSRCNQGYAGVAWGADCRAEEVLIPHALAVDPARQGAGLGRAIVAAVLDLARAEGKRAVRLDILGGNEPARRLYTRCGFRFAAAKPMYYEDTGWTEYEMYEYLL